MRKHIILAAIAVMSIAAFVGCKKSSSTPGYSMKATVGTTAYSVSNCFGVKLDSSLTIEGIAGGTTTSFPYLAVTLSTWSGNTGTFALDSFVNFGEYILSDTSAKESKSGTLTITSVSSTTIAGTFSFTCSDGTVVSGGSFNAKVQP
jgi:hypothetical protein